jgi:hypothetical protein
LRGLRDCTVFSVRFPLFSLPELTINFTLHSLQVREGGAVRQYDFYPPPDGVQDQALLKSTSADHVYLISGRLLKNLQQTTRASLATPARDTAQKTGQDSAPDASN